MLQKILIANRGEIAVRIIRACQAVGLATVAVYSEADAPALHVRMADQSVLIGPPLASASYLSVEQILAAARRTRADAIHPGYGFLSEQAHFAAACQAAGLVFIGPSPAAMLLMGDKIAAKQLAEQVGVPTVPGYLGDDQQPERLLVEAQRVGFPLLIKAAAGGGGRGMRVVAESAQFLAALASAQREAQAAFGNPAVFLERLIERPRHIEIQILADQHGHMVHLFERECSIQRRHQKIIEESPSVVLPPALRASMGGAAVALAQAAGYTNAGTVEFLLDRSGRFFFLEMNTRLQVEHPVTELVTGQDLVQLQLAIADGHMLPWTQEDLQQRGHAIEARICAEHPVTFLPATGQIALFAPPHGDQIRNDSGIVSGDQVSIHYDPLLAKLIVYGQDRAAAVAQLQHALADYTLLGVTTNLPLLRAIAEHPAFIAGDISTDFLEREQVAGLESGIPAVVLAGAAILDAQRAAIRTASDPWAAAVWRVNGVGLRCWYRVDGQEHGVLLNRTAAGYRAIIGAEQLTVAQIVQQDDRLTFEADGMSVRLRFVQQEAALLIGWNGWSYQIECAPAVSVDTYLAHGHGDRHNASLEAPMPGTVVRVLAEEGQLVEAHQPLVILEAMKMEHIVAAPYAGIVRQLFVTVGALVIRGAVLAEVESAD